MSQEPVPYGTTVDEDVVRFLAEWFLRRAALDYFEMGAARMANTHADLLVFTRVWREITRRNADIAETAPDLMLESIIETRHQQN
jgi:hypothetical protein